MTETLSLYLHIPFCRTRCTYCAFNTYSNSEFLIKSYILALQRELALVAGPGFSSSYVVNTIYLGGGTPNLLPAAAVGAILNECARVFSLLPALEITLEVNPGTVKSPDLVGWRASGVNRLSIGMQTAHSQELTLFARGHSVRDVRYLVHQARRVGFDNLNLDLIYGIPHQTLTMWRHSLTTALQLNPDHLSLYSLGIEDATPLQHWIARGLVSSPDPDCAADMYEWASERLSVAGYEHYEISNWARPGMACQHNLHVWHYLPYVGFGAGAHGYAAQTRYVNVLSPTAYIERIHRQHETLPFPYSGAAEWTETITENTAMAEMMILGLRLLRQGVNSDVFYTRFHHDLWKVYGDTLRQLIDDGLLERTPENGVRLSQRGQLLGNRVFAAFV